MSSGYNTAHMEASEMLAQALKQMDGILASEYCNTYVPANTKHLCNIHTMSVQRQRRWADIV